MSSIIAVTAMLAFVAGLFGFSVVTTSAAGLYTAREAARAMRDPRLHDIEREQVVQRASLRLFGILGSILLRTIAALALSAVPILCADLLGLVALEETLALLVRPDVILGSTLTMIGAWWIGQRMWSRR